MKLFNLKNKCRFIIYILFIFSNLVLSQSNKNNNCLENAYDSPAKSDFPKGKKIFVTKTKLITIGYSDKLYKNIIKIYDYETHTLLNIISKNVGNFFPAACCISNDGNFLATFTDDRHIGIWDINTGKCVKIFKQESKLSYGVLNVLHFSNNDNVLVFACKIVEKSSQLGHHVLQFLNIQNGETIKKIVFDTITNPNAANHYGFITSICYSSDGSKCLTSTFGGTINIWNTNNNYELVDNFTVKHGIESINLSPDDKYLGVTGQQRSYIVDFLSKKILKTLGTGSSEYHSYSDTYRDSPAKNMFLSNGNLLAIQYEDRCIFVWDYKKNLDNSDHKYIANTDLESLEIDYGNSKSNNNWIGIKDFCLTPNQDHILAAFNKETKVTICEITYRPKSSPKPVLPIITWESPLSDYTSISSTLFKVRACVRSQTPVTKTILYIDGLPYKNRDWDIVPSNDCQAMMHQSISLQSGTHRLKITATNDGGTVTSEEKTIEVQDNQPKPIITSNNYALLIAVQDYTDPNINSLNKPIQDAESLQSVLVSKYGFLSSQVKLLRNPTKSEIIDALIHLRNLSSSDNLLIYYGGHGKMDGDMGFWLPSNATKKSHDNWLSNADVIGYISSIPSKHTLALVDACFGGSLIMRDLGEEHACEIQGSLTSRQAMTSGTKTVVPDESVFMRYLIKKLNENTEDCLAADKLFHLLKTPVVNNSPIKQVPLMSPIPSTGDEGGSFIFRLKY